MMTADSLTESLNTQDLNNFQILYHIIIKEI